MELIIDNVLDAYETKTNKLENIKKNILDLGIGWVVLLCISLLIGVVLFVLVPFVPHSASIISVICYGILTRIIISLLERRRRTIWRKNIIAYNEDMNLLSDILKASEFDLYNKNKIKQLVRKLQKAIKEQEAKIESKGKETKEFLNTCVLPVIAFFIGQVKMESAGLLDVIEVVVVLVIIIVGGKYAISSVIRIIKILEGDYLEKQKYFCLKLQDLLDRDFIIEKDDLLEVK